MKAKFFLSFILATVALVAGAQHRHAPVSAADKSDLLRYGAALVAPPPDLRKALRLTPVEEQRMHLINATSDRQAKAAYKAGPAKGGDRLQPIYEGQWRALFNVLTAKQRVILKGWVDTHHQHRQPHPPHQTRT